MRVLDRDDLVVLAPDVLADERLRVVSDLFVIAVGDCNESHQKLLLVSRSGPMRRPLGRPVVGRSPSERVDVIEQIVDRLVVAAASCAISAICAP